MKRRVQRTGWRGLMATAMALVCGVGMGRGVAAAALQGTHGRIDVYVVEGAFELQNPRGSGRASVGFCGFLGPGKERTGVTCEKKLGRDWEQIWVEFVAGGDGLVDIDLQGEWYGQEGPNDVRLVWTDDVRVVGAPLQNGSFEEVGPDGRPAGWRFTGDFPPAHYSRNGRVAHSGKACVAVWYGSQARQQFPVVRGKTYRVSAWFRLLDPAAVPRPISVPLQFPFERYAQEVRILFRTPQAARKATLRALPLYDGRQWAVSSRWDDNNPADLELRDVLSKHGHHGTFYLNGLWRDWSSATTSATSEFGRELLKGGNSIGAHSLTHPFLSYCSRGRIFEEVAGDRMVWEAATDTPVVSYAFSYCNFTNPHEGSAVHADIARALERAGLYHVANEPEFEDVETGLILSPIMPADGADIDGWVESALADPSFREKHPNLTYSMHAWYRTPEAWAKFEAQLERYGHNPAWWYCNQNQYAAYRYQFRYTRLGRPTVQGSVQRVRIERPELLDLGDAIPLTLEVAGVPRSEVKAVHCATAECAPAGRASEPFRFHLHHDRGRALPERIGMVVPNTQNRAALGETDQDEDFPGLRALLHFRSGTLRLILENRAGPALAGVRVTYRLPLGWREGVARRRLPDVLAGSRREDAWRPTLADATYKLHAGSRFFLAQVDFVRGGRHGRLYAACCAPGAERDHSYPQGGFLRLGPLAPNQVDLSRLAEDVRQGRLTTRPWALPDGTHLDWRADDGPLQPPYLDPELVRVSGAWWNEKPGLYLLQTDIRSDREQTAGLRTIRGAFQRVFLNGADVTDRETVTLRAGANRLVLVAHESVGCYLRLVRPGTEERLTDIRYDLPEQNGGPAPVEGPRQRAAARKPAAGATARRDLR